MPSVASPSEILASRDARERRIRRLAGRGTLLFASVNVPGPRKNGPAIDALLGWGLRILSERIPGARVVGAGWDGLGPWFALRAPLGAEALKQAAVACEESFPGGRLLDLDVLGPGGKTVTRAGLGLPPRRCFVCGEPAIDCLVRRSHDGETTFQAFDALLALPR